MICTAADVAAAAEMLLLGCRAVLTSITQLVVWLLLAKPKTAFITMIRRMQ